MAPVQAEQVTCKRQEEVQFEVQSKMHKTLRRTLWLAVDAAPDRPESITYENCC